jgi:hypothetical protein
MNTPLLTFQPLDRAGSAKIAAFVRQVVHLDMGLSNFPEERILRFVRTLRQLGSRISAINSSKSFDITAL